MPAVCLHILALLYVTTCGVYDVLTHCKGELLVCQDSYQLKQACKLFIFLKQLLPVFC